MLRCRFPGFFVRRPLLSLFRWSRHPRNSVSRFADVPCTRINFISFGSVDHRPWYDTRNDNPKAVSTRPSAVLHDPDVEFPWRAHTPCLYYAYTLLGPARDHGPTVGNSWGGGEGMKARHRVTVYRAYTTARSLSPTTNFEDPNENQNKRFICEYRIHSISLFTLH